VTKAVIINSAETMCRVRVFTLKDYSEQTIKTLHRTGVLHVEEAKELTPVDRAAIENQQKEVVELLTSFDKVLGYITEKQQVSPAGEDIEVIYTRPFSEIKREVVSLHTKFAGVQDKISKIEQDVAELSEQIKYLGSLGEHRTLRLRDLSFSGGYLFSGVFVLPTETYETIRDQLKEYTFGSTATAVEDETVLYAIGKVENKEIIKSMVTAAGGRSLVVPSEELALGEFLDRSENRLQQLKEKSTKLREELEHKVKGNLERMALLRGVLKAERQQLRVLVKASEAKYITLFEGWIPEASAESVVSELKINVDCAFVEAREPEPAEEPPTKLKNPTALKPFQVVVNLFATPRYREWDPTPIIAYSFATFFGLMIADVVYAIGCIMVAMFLIPKFLGVRDEGIKLLQRTLYTSGGVGFVLGLLSGSYLGNIHTLLGFENLGLVASVQQGLQNPLTFIVLALFIGVVHVNIGHTLALIKGIKEKNTGLIINKIGLFLLQFGSLYIFRMLMNIDLRDVLGVIMNVPPFPPLMYTAATYCAIVGIVLIVVGNFKQIGGMAAITWLFDVTGILGDVMSYARIAGVGLATYYLAAVFNTLGPLFGSFVPGSGMAAAVGGGILTVIILIVGHVVNLLLSVLTGFIHSLRLCFVEFLFKFYEGGGREYNPFKLIKRPALIVGTKS